MKKIISLITALLIMGNICAFAKEALMPADCFTYEETADGITITGLKDNAPKAIVIPGEINGKKVTLANDAFEAEKIESVVIEEGITHIPQKCFYNCESLKSVVLPDSVTALEYLAFANSGIEKITFPKNLKLSGYSTFFDCKSLKEVNLNNATGVGLFSFRNCDALESVTHSGSLKAIADYAFAGCYSLKHIDLSTVESVGKNALYGCRSLSFINLQSIQKWEGFLNDAVDEDSMMLKSTGFYSHHQYSDPVDYKALLLGVAADTVRIRFPETDEGLGAVFINTGVKNVVFDNFTENINKWEFYSATSIDTSINRQVKLEKKTPSFTIYGREDAVRTYAESIGAEYRELIDITLDGKTLYPDALPYIKNDRALVPMRGIFEALGATVTWDNTTKTAIGVKNGTEVKITIGENVLYKNGEKVELDMVAEITNDRTMVPVRAISEAFGYIVEWDNNEKTVNILDPYKRKYYTYDENEQVISISSNLWSTDVVRYSYLYDETDRVVRVWERPMIKNSDRLFEYAYNEKGQVIAKGTCKDWWMDVLRGASLDKEVSFTEVEKYFYNDEGQLAYAEYPTGERRYYVYEDGKLIKEVNEKGETIKKYVYHDDGRINYTDNFY